jgi:4-alpha-glucanotransferase
VDLVRVDHFRGFDACWSIPAGEETAINGHWEKAPGLALFEKLSREHSAPQIVAEDLGIITPEVEALRDRFGFPGMKILHFAFDSGPDNPYLPHNYQPNCVVYTGTHDNNTTLGWWQEISATTRDEVRRYLDQKHPDLPWAMIDLAMGSVAALCIIPFQDILELGQESRFNRPGQAVGNWQWRMGAADLNGQRAKRLRGLTEKHNRLKSVDWP